MIYLVLIILDLVKMEKRYLEILHFSIKIKMIKYKIM